MPHIPATTLITPPSKPIRLACNYLMIPIWLPLPPLLSPLIRHIFSPDYFIPLA